MRKSERAQERERGKERDREKERERERETEIEKMREIKNKYLTHFTHLDVMAIRPALLGENLETPRIFSVFRES